MKRAAFILLLTMRVPVFADAGASGGLTLLEAPGARAAALGEAFSTVEDDVTVAAYNPASLQTISSPMISLSYQSGLLDDRSGRVDAGIKRLGVSAAYFSAGDVDLLENGVSRTVTAQRDLVVSLGTAYQAGRFSLGVAGKYLTSELVEENKATAWAGDAGIQFPALGARWSVAVQNLGTKLTYLNEGDSLPEIFRGGVAIPLKIRHFGVHLMGEAPYFMNEREWRLAGGLEMKTGPLAFRVGYRSKAELEGLTLGTGLSIGGLTLDYAFGFVDDLSARQRVSVVFRFRESSRDESIIDRKLRERDSKRKGEATSKRKKSEPQAPGPWRMRMGDIE